ncbi:MAG: hypothetical protein NVS2B3_13260 [Vulcanimicrobiaceae bacterium]
MTGALLRGPGLLELEREIARAHRSQRSLVLAFIDVDGLRGINNRSGHAAGDRMLRLVVETVRANVRAQDLVIRYGGDEFVCVFSGLDVADAIARCARVDVALGEAPEDGSISVGIAQLETGDSVGMLLARADASLYEKRALRRSAQNAIGPTPGRTLAS